MESQRINSLGQFRSYRHLSHTRQAPAADTNGADGYPTANQRAMYLLDTSPFDGVKFRIEFQHDNTVPTASATFDVLFYDPRLNAWDQDISQRIVVNERGAQSFDILTGGRQVLLRLAAVTGALVTLDVKAAVFNVAKV